MYIFEFPNFIKTNIRLPVYNIVALERTRGGSMWRHRGSTDNFC